jgi:DNA invertase Pin-like site-specific DNA recombinase
MMGALMGREKAMKKEQETKRRAALYARVSTANHHQDPEAQLNDLRAYCARQGWDVAEEFVDRMSGTKQSRPDLNRMMTAAREKRFEVILVWKFDRFARSMAHLANALKEFRSLGIEFVSLKDGADTTTSPGRLLFGILASIAEFERDIISERIRMGLRNARAKGKRLGRAVGYGKKVDLADIRARHKAGETNAAIGESLGLSGASISRLLSGKQRK